MAEQQYKRNIAYKLRIGDLLMGKPVNNGERFGFLELGDKKIVRVNIVGNIIERYESEGERKYLFLTLDDGSGQIKLKIFGDDSDRFKEVVQGQTVVVIGTLRYWNDELYISPEIIRDLDPKYLLIRKLETEKNKTQSSSNKDDSDNVLSEKEQTTAIKDKILDLIKSAEEDGGIETKKVLERFSDVSPDIINQEIKKFLEEGIAFEPRPGKIRYLG
ncbi:MAG: OB-fold nucleic acid binding domain-containing protein [Candidatus Pacearchaeota archaeon]